MAENSKKGRGDSARPGPVSQVEAPALRARVTAAVAGGFVDIWRWLQRSSIGLLVGFVDIWRWLQRSSVRFHDSVAQAVEPAPPYHSAGLPQRRRRRRACRPHHSAADHPEIRPSIMYVDEKPKKKKAQRHQSPAPPLPQPAPPLPPQPARQLRVVDGIEVPLEQENQYKEYCMRALNCQGSSSLCHICVFEKQLDHNGIVGNGGMIIHCSRYHNGTGLLVCEDRYCQVRFRKGSHRDHRLHIYFFHGLPRGWWLNRQ